MKKVFKYTLDFAHVQTITLPFGATILTIQFQRDEIQLWALVNPDEGLKVIRIIEMFGTGHAIPEAHKATRQYLCSFQNFKQSEIYHAFEFIQQ